MIVKSLVRLRYWFYPTGNTPAVNLLRDRVPSSQGCTKILCLASGDVRNVLFTLWTENPSKQRSYKVTCCDLEPAILARNILLFSFIMTEASEPSRAEYMAPLWELYYHFFVRSHALHALAVHLTQLLDASASIEHWNSSCYGTAMRFLNEGTLREVRHYWQLYHNACGQNKTSEVRATIQEIAEQHTLGEDRIFRHGSRSTGIHALSSANVMSNAFRSYWKTGVTAGNEEDVSALKEEDGGYANPLMYISSAPLGKFAVHYGTDPLLGFHLANVFDATNRDSDIFERLTSTAKSQFFSWCESFMNHVRIGAVRLYFHCGDAISLCYELQRRTNRSPEIPKHLYTYARAWSSLSLDLSTREDLDECCRFDIIDSSNISDHVGILNLLPAALPLLDDCALAVFYTETLLRVSEEATSYLDELLRAEAGSVCLMIGVAPTASLLGTSIEHFGSEAIVSQSGRERGAQSQMRMRIAWKRPYGGDFAAGSSGPLLSANPDDLASFFFKWYLNMFSAFEDITTQLSVHFRRAVNPLSQDLNYYTRMTVVALIGLARKHVHSDWRKCIDLLLVHIGSDRTLLVGSNSLQEIYMLLHMSGLYQVPALEISPKAAALQFAAATRGPNTTTLARYPDLPNIIAVTLLVPREKLIAFTSADLNQIGTPGLHIAIYNEGVFENSFHAIQACFGKLILADDARTGSIEDDPLGWKGKSDLIVTCLVPAFQLLVRREGGTRVALVVNSSAANSYFIPVLGLHMRVFDASVNDRQNLHLLRALPGVVDAQQAISLGAQNHDEPAVSLASKNGRLEILTLRKNFLENDEKDRLKNGTIVEVFQETPCTMTIKLEKRSWRLKFPFPVDGSRSKTRIARKQQWVEITVPISLAMQPNGYALRPFPVVLDKGQPIAWGMSRINLDDHPIIATTSLVYLNGYLGMGLSRAERDFQQTSSSAPTLSRSLFEVKESITALFTGFHRKDNATKRTWNAFRLAKDDDSDLLIFVKAMRHDRDMSSICLDAYVVPLTSARVRQMSGPLVKMVCEKKILSVKISESEEIMWKQIMPALVERCRYTWEHKSTCEYGKLDPICPRSLLHGKVSICSCGEGREMSKMPQEYAGFSRFATRVAIPLLSAVPFVEPMAFDLVLSQLSQRATQGESSEGSEGLCHYCGSSGADLKLCAGCGLVKYCNKKCQSQGWKAHKLTCRSINGLGSAKQ